MHLYDDEQKQFIVFFNNSLSHILAKTYSVQVTAIDFKEIKNNLFKDHRIQR